MKNKLYIILAAVALMLGTPSCSDYLDEDNKVGATADLTYSTSTGIQGLVTSAYSFARGWYGKEAGLGLSETGTDLFYYGYDNKQKSLNSYNLTAVSLDDNSSDNASLDHSRGDRPQLVGQVDMHSTKEKPLSSTWFWKAFLMAAFALMMLGAE